MNKKKIYASGALGSKPPDQMQTLDQAAAALNHLWRESIVTVNWLVCEDRRYKIKDF